MAAVVSALLKVHTPHYECVSLNLLLVFFSPATCFLLPIISLLQNKAPPPATHSAQHTDQCSWKHILYVLFCYCSLPRFDQVFAGHRFSLCSSFPCIIHSDSFRCSEPSQTRSNAGKALEEEFKGPVWQQFSGVTAAAPCGYCNLWHFRTGHKWKWLKTKKKKIKADHSYILPRICKLSVTRINTIWPIHVSKNSCNSLETHFNSSYKNLF